jgi:hypothetical protein
VTARGVLGIANAALAEAGTGSTDSWAYASLNDECPDDLIGVLWAFRLTLITPVEWVTSSTLKRETGRARRARTLQLGQQAGRILREA